MPGDVNITGVSTTKLVFDATVIKLLTAVVAVAVVVVIVNN